MPSEIMWNLMRLALTDIGEYETGVLLNYDGEERIYYEKGWIPLVYRKLSTLRDIPTITQYDVAEKLANLPMEEFDTEEDAAEETDGE